jgi:5-methylcytosine-specific restriction endonuclease McrA
MREILNNAKSLREVILIFGLNSNGSGGYTNIKNKIKNLGLETPNYNYYGNGSKKNRKKNEEIFIEHSTYPRQKLKKRIINENLIPYKCDKCNNLGNWMDEPIILQLDHINGINDDNTLSNLRFLCPNCHSQTETFSGRNNKKEIVKNKKERHRKVERPPYERLLIEIQEFGYCGTGRKYGVSDNAIRK